MAELTCQTYSVCTLKILDSPKRDRIYMLGSTATQRSLSSALLLHMCAHFAGTFIFVFVVFSATFSSHIIFRRTVCNFEKAPHTQLLPSDLQPFKKLALKKLFSTLLSDDHKKSLSMYFCLFEKCTAHKY